MDTLILITVDAQKREIAHRFEKNRNGTQIFAERPIILKQEGEHNTDKVIKRISGQETDLPINTVADNVGYGNYSYFTRLFKKVTDMTPAEYRNIHHL